MTRRLVFGLVVLLAAGALITYWFVSRRGTDSAASMLQAEPHNHDAAATSGVPRGTVDLDTRRQQLIGVRTVVVRRAVLDTTIRAAGTVAVDETGQSEISTRVDGWIRELFADVTGRVIRRGEPLFTLYSPDLIATQHEYLLALRGRTIAASGDERTREYADRLVSAARERLLRLDMSSDDVAQLERTETVADTLTFRSPVTGTIVEKAALRGMRVAAGQMLYRVADLSTVWVEAQVHETDLATVRTGVRAQMTFDAYPLRTFSGVVSFISPTITPETRTARIRIVLPNPGGLLKPNMLAEVAVRSRSGAALVVPADAIVNTGAETLAFVADGNGHFSPRRLKVGHQTSEGVEVVAGLNEGETVASSATFFLDSESQLRGALEMYTPATAPTPANAPPEHGVDVTFRSESADPTPGDVVLLVGVNEHATPLLDAEVTVVLSMPAMPAMNMPAMRTQTRLSPSSGGIYRGTATIPSAGRWDAAVTVLKEGRLVVSRQFALLVR